MIHTNRPLRVIITAAPMACLVMAGWTERAPADTYTDDFADGIDEAFWETATDQPLYVVDDSHGEVEIWKPTGGDYGLQIQRVSFRPPLLGDFSVEIDFREAVLDRIDGAPGNQVQLNVLMGGEYFGLVRSDEQGAGHNVHVFVNPPGGWAGTRPVSDVSGTFRIERTGTTVAGTFNGDLVHSATVAAGTEARVWLSLQNNGTRDSTHVVFDDFAVVSGEILGAPSTLPPPIDEPTLELSSNPVRESVWVEWTAPDVGLPDLRIYDARGRVVAVLTGDTTTGLTGRIEWQPARTLASGVYYLELSSGHRRSVRSVVVRR